MNVNEVTYNEIKGLSDVDLSKLLLHLLKAESEKYNFTGIDEIIVPLRINVADAGEDGRVLCEATNGSVYIKNAKSVFQNKATDISPAEVYKEFFSVNLPAAPARKGKPAEPQKLELKNKIKEILDQGGQYVFFVGHDYNAELRDNRLKSANKALSDYNLLHHTTYAPSQVRFIEANEIANWTNEFISAVSLVQASNGIHRPMGLQILNELDSYEEYRQIPFQTNEQLNKFISQIEATINEERGSLRIIGHSGLGKTRLVFEAFKQSNKIDQAVYFNINKDADTLIHFVRTYGSKYDGILVVDNCDFATHKLLKDEITRRDSKFKLVTLDYNVSEENETSKTTQENYIFLHSEFYTDIVKEILKEQFGARLDRTHLDQIAAFSEGYPSMAVLFATARLNGLENIAELLDDDKIERLAFGRDYANRDGDKFKVLIACSIFSRFNRPAIESVQLLNEGERDLAKGQAALITNHICDPSQSPRTFKESTDYFEKRRVLERRGNYLSVRPIPLALKLAMEWWRYTEKEKLIELFPMLENASLAIPLAERLAQLDQLHEARQVVNDLWGIESPFGSAEVLNTALGSRLFRSVAQVNPQATLSTLEKEFGSMSIEELQANVGDGRRYLVWTLEMLVFRSETFERAVRLLFRFAAAENENISNNATGQLLHLFQIYLAGTEADLNQRLDAIIEQLNSDSEKIKRLAVLAMIRGLKGHHFSRTLGAEQQGMSTPLLDFRPTWPQVADYWEKILTRLVDVADKNHQYLSLIKEGIARSFRNLLADDMGHLVEQAILRIQNLDNGYWKEAIHELQLTLQYESIGEDNEVLVAKLLKSLQPKSFEDKITHIVSVPEWSHFKDDSGHYIDHQGIAAERFAETLHHDGVELVRYLEILLTGEQRKGFQFGRRFGELAQDENFAKAALEKLAILTPAQRNPDFAAGYVSALPKLQQDALIEQIVNDKNISEYAVYFLRTQKYDVDNLIKLLDYVDSGRIDVKQFFQLPYGGGLKLLATSDFIYLIARLSRTQEGALVAMELVQFYAHDEEEKWSSLKGAVRDIVIQHNLFTNELRGNLQYMLYHTIERLLKEPDDQLCITITKQILTTAEQDRLGSFDTSLKSLVSKLIKFDFKAFWDVIGVGILNNHTYLNLKFFLGTDNGAYGGPGLLDLADYSYLVEWCAVNSPLAPKRIAYMMPVTAKENKRELHPLAALMLDRFGSLPGFMNEFSANVHSFGSVGSVVPYLRDQQALFQSLISHQDTTVSAWAKREVESFETSIKREQLKEEGDYW